MVILPHNINTLVDIQTLTNSSLSVVLGFLLLKNNIYPYIIIFRTVSRSNFLKCIFCSLFICIQCGAGCEGGGRRSFAPVGFFFKNKKGYFFLFSSSPLIKTRPKIRVYPQTIWWHIGPLQLISILTIDSKNWFFSQI